MRAAAGTVSITVGDGGNIEGVSNTFVDQPGECKAKSGGLYYFPRECLFLLCLNPKPYTLNRALMHLWTVEASPPSGRYIGTAQCRVATRC